MSSETQGYASVGDINLLIEHWHQTQLGKLVKDDAMRPFVDQMKKQLEEKISGAKEKLGITYSDLQDIAGGEVGVGMVAVKNGRAAIAMTVDTTGHQRQLEKLLKKVDADIEKMGGKKSTANHDGTEFVTFDIPPQKEGDIARQTIYFIKDNILVATDNAQLANEMFQHFQNQEGSLSEVVGYQQTMERCKKEAGDLTPDMRWFVNPFGYASAVQTLEPADAKKKGKDYVKILSEQGFDAIQALGGFVNLSVDGTYELLHRTSVYAPPIPGEEQKYELAMRMMKFPNQTELTANKWIPRQLASYRTVSCDLQNAFDHVSTLFDAIAGYEDAFANMVEGLERDPYGPQINVERDLVAHVGERVTFVTDYELPINPKCERFMIVLEVKDEKAMAATVAKLMESEPNSVKGEFEGKTIWEIEEAQDDIPEIDIAIQDLDLLEENPDAVSEDQPLGGNALASSAVCVTDNHLFIASHADFLKKILAAENADKKLTTATDFKEVESTMTELLPGPISARFFVRTDEAYRPIYELIRQGKMPESETLLGRVLNRLLAPETDDETVLREQKIDGTKLPEFEVVRRYFGPSGTVVRSDEDGWFVVGATLSKQTAQARASKSESSDEKKVR